MGRRTLNIEEAASLLGIGRGLGYELARQGKLPGVLRLGRRLLVSRVAVEQWLADGGAPQAPAQVRQERPK